MLQKVSNLHCRYGAQICASTVCNFFSMHGLAPPHQSNFSSWLSGVVKCDLVNIFRNGLNYERFLRMYVICCRFFMAVIVKVNETGSIEFPVSFNCSQQFLFARSEYYLLFSISHTIKIEDVVKYITYCLWNLFSAWKHYILLHFWSYYSRFYSKLPGRKCSVVKAIL